MIKDTVRSLKKDFSKSLFYAVTLILISMIMFLFFQLSYQSGVVFINSQNNTATFMTVFVIFICMIVLFFANDFYTKKKAKDLAVRFICGGTYIQVAGYLLRPIFLLFIISLPIGLVLGYELTPVVEKILWIYFQTKLNLSFQLLAIQTTLAMMLIEFLWIVVLNLGYTYRNTIAYLLYDDRQMKSAWHSNFPFSLSLKVKKIFSLILFVLPIPVFYTSGNDLGGIFLFSLIGMIGFSMFISYIMIPLLHQWIEERFLDCSLRLISLGFIRTDLKVLKKNIILLMTSDILLLAAGAMSIHDPIEMMLSMVSFTIINFLLVLSMMFKLNAEMTTRYHIFQSLEHLGYMKKSQHMIMIQEIFCLYAFVLLVGLIYIGNVLVVLTIFQGLHSDIVLGLFVIFILPFFICSFINYINYHYLMKKASSS